MAEWEDAITTVRQGDYYRVLFRPEAQVKDRKLPKTLLDHEKTQPQPPKTEVNSEDEVL